MQAGQGGSRELLCPHAGEADFLPDFGDVRLFGSLEGSTILLQPHEGSGKLVVVTEASEDDLGSLELLGFVAAVSNFVEISLVRLADEGLHVSKSLISAHGV